MEPRDSYELLAEASRLSTTEAKFGFRALHRTEKQNLFRNFLAIVEDLAEDHDANFFDPRNQASAEIAKAIRDNGLVKPLPYI